MLIILSRMNSAPCLGAERGFGNFGGILHLEWWDEGSVMFDQKFVALKVFFQVRAEANMKFPELAELGSRVLTTHLPVLGSVC